jgi:hypothetical protein
MSDTWTQTRFEIDPQISTTARFIAPLPPMIGPPPQGAARPVFSVMIPTYNSTEFLEATLRSLLDQAPGADEMEIEVVDNCSTEGDPERLVREIGGDRVKFYRQPENVGAIENFNTCLRRARGQWVHILHSDDVLRPGFFAAARKAIAAQPEAGAIVFRVIYIDDDGMWLGLSDIESRTPGLLSEDFAQRQLLDQRIQFVGMIVRRKVYEELGGFRLELQHCADWDMWNRIAVARPLYYEPEPLACYRLHEAAHSSRVMQTGENVVDERRCIRISRCYVPPEQSRHFFREAMKAAAVRASRRMRHCWRSNDRATAMRQLREALNCSLAPVILARLACLFALVILERRHHAPSPKSVTRLTTGLASQKAHGRAAEAAPGRLADAAVVAAVAAGTMAEAIGTGENSMTAAAAPVVHAAKELI